MQNETSTKNIFSCLGKKDEDTFTILTTAHGCYPGSVSDHLLNFFPTLTPKLLTKSFN